VKIGSSLSAGNLHSSVAATGDVTAQAGGMLASKRRRDRFVVLVMMESSRRANPALEDSVRSRNRVLEVGISAAQASFAKGALQCQRAVEDGVALVTAVTWIGKTDRVLPAEPPAQLRQAHGLIVGDVEDDALRGDSLCSLAAISYSNGRR
jgi:hypothetical protein